MKKSKPQTTKIAVHVPASWIPDAGSAAILEEVKTRVERYAGELLVGLGMPGGSDFDWKTHAEIESISMKINGLTARLGFDGASFDGFTQTLPMGASLCEDLLRNRELFVTGAVVEAAEEQAHVSFQNFKKNEQADVVRQLFRQGYGLARLAEDFAEEAPTDPQVWLERCVGRFDLPNFSIFGPAAQIEPDEDPLDYNRLVEAVQWYSDELFQLKGVPVPRAQTHVRADLDANEFVFKINDLVFPTRDFGPTQEHFVKYLAFLQQNMALFVNRGLVQYLLDSLQTTYPNLLSLAQTRFSIEFITAVLRELVAENISIRPLARILEILTGGDDRYVGEVGRLEIAPITENVFFLEKEKSFEQLDLGDWVELVRISLKNGIVQSANLYLTPGAPPVLGCLLLSKETLEQFRDFDALPTAEKTALLDRTHRQIAPNRTAPSGKPGALVAPAFLRKKVREAVALEFPEVPVFSIQECLPKITFQPYFTIA